MSLQRRKPRTVAEVWSARAGGKRYGEREESEEESEFAKASAEGRASAEEAAGGEDDEREDVSKAGFGRRTNCSILWISDAHGSSLSARRRIESGSRSENCTVPSTLTRGPVWTFTDTPSIQPNVWKPMGW